jgi:hypothetical protein
MKSFPLSLLLVASGMLACGSSGEASGPGPSGTPEPSAETRSPEVDAGVPVDGSIPAPADGSATGRGTPVVFRVGGAGVDFGKDIAADSAGNIYVTGYFSATVDFDPGPATSSCTATAGTDAFLAKYGPEGNLLWVRCFAGPGADMPHTVRVDALGRATVVGYFSNTVNFDPNGASGSRTSNGGRDAFVVQYSPDGGFRWVVTFGSAGEDDATDVAFDAKNQAHVSGSITGGTNMDPLGNALISSRGATDAVVATYDGNGSYVGAFQLGGPLPDAGYAIASDAAGNVVVGGTFQGVANLAQGTPQSRTSRGSGDIFVGSYSVDGQTRSLAQIGGTGFDLLAPGGLDRDAEGNVVVTGSFQGSADFGEPGQRTLVSNGDDDLFLAKFGPNGRLSWALGVGGSGGDRGHRCKFDRAGNVVVAGWWRGTANFDPAGSARRAAATTNQGSDILVATYSGSGSFVWAEGFGGGTGDGSPQSEAGWNLAAGMALDPTGHILVTGKFFGTASFGAPGQTTTLSSAGASDGVVIKLDSQGALDRL